jgi:hypothetical protein
VKEDVLEQIVDDYLKFRGYFTVHNVPFKPRTDHPAFDGPKDRVPSDVDVVAYHPRKRGIDRVIAVSCKAWQSGFDATNLLDRLKKDKKAGNRKAWQLFRELWVPKWSEAFRAAVYELTGAKTFAYRIAVTLLTGDASAWAADRRIAENLPGCSIGFLPLEEMWSAMLAELTTRPAASEVGRLVQLLKAAGLTAPEVVRTPEGPAPGSDAAVVEEVEASG